MIRRFRSLDARAKRALVGDGVLVIGAAIVVWSVLASDEIPIARHRLGLVVVSAAALLGFLARRGHPLAVSVASFAAWTAAAALSPVSTGPMFVGVLASFALAGLLCRPIPATIAWLAGAGTVAFATASSLPPAQWLGDFLLSMVFCTAMWGGRDAGGHPPPARRGHRGSPHDGA